MLWYAQCLLTVAVKGHPNFPFIVCHNREEDLQRPTTDPDFATGGPLLAGTDGDFGGTWFGLNKVSGRFAAVTNIRDVAFPFIPKHLATSRGRLLLDWLNSTLTLPLPPPVATACYGVPGSTSLSAATGASVSAPCRIALRFVGSVVTRLVTQGANVPRHRAPSLHLACVLALRGKYNGFNLLLASLSPLQELEVTLLSNGRHPVLEGRPVSSTREFSNDSAWLYRVPNGVHSMSNSSFDDESWPKVPHVRDGVMNVLQQLPVKCGTQHLLLCCRCRCLSPSCRLMW